MTTILQARNITKEFGTTKAMRGISLDVHTGEVLALMGPSGSGKSTLLHALAAIDRPTSGEVYFQDRRIDNLNDTERTILRRTAFGFIFQFGQLVPELTALDNVAVPLLLNGISRQKAQSEAAKWLTRVGLDHRTNSLPGKLSGGEVQRVAIARALCYKPAVLFADEPTGSLDSNSSTQVMEMFLEQARENEMTVVMVTHEPSIAAYADRTVIVRDGLLADLKSSGITASHTVPASTATNPEL
ncbi:ABC transporter ATP-binding protein [Arcanobacterium hippocoleae]|uniref:ABC transport system ATP-binding protein n=1 Tax=Arcanobacterium hippocoleae TaxID=149017 RepID=A0ABU1SZN4_9ACTO|nr:ABC transporter ATP-binding protein [Arcanobacterium hippocoleae]MDR6938586.1 putative ABC transport system ATP-binding protein [Arcanobacterium hippocoleae]